MKCFITIISDEIMWEDIGGSWLVYILKGTNNYGKSMWLYLHQ